MTKTVKFTFKVCNSRTTGSGHRSSNGYVRNVDVETNVSGPYFSEVMNLTYQDICELSAIANKICYEHSSHTSGEDWEMVGDDYCDYSTADFGFSAIFNDKYSLKYGIKMTLGTLEECIHGWDSCVDTINNAIKDACIAKYIAINKQKERIKQLKAEIEQTEATIKKMDTDEYQDSCIISNLYPLLKSSPNLFDVNRPIYKTIYALDIAIANNDDDLQAQLVGNGAKIYLTRFIPSLSAKIGSISKVVDFLRDNKKLTDEDFDMVFQFILLLSKEEQTQLFSLTSEVIRNGKVIISQSEKIEFNNFLKSKYSNRDWDHPQDKYAHYYSPISRLFETYLKEDDIEILEQAYEWASKINWVKGDLAYLSIKYGSKYFLDKLTAEKDEYWDLEDVITDDNIFISRDLRESITPQKLGQKLYDELNQYIAIFNLEYIF